LYHANGSSVYDCALNGNYVGVKVEYADNVVLHLLKIADCDMSHTMLNTDKIHDYFQLISIKVLTRHIG
jgi:hypothetical protein